MKMLTLCFSVILITTFTTLLFSEHIPKLQLDGLEMAFDILPSGNIFYKDSENNILLIDFKEVNGKISKVKVMLEEQLLMEDKVGDLAMDSIYEVDLNTYGKGIYKITLITVEENEISESFVIK